MSELTVRRYQCGDAPKLAAVFIDSVRNGTERHYDQRQRQAWAPSVPDSAEWTARLEQQIVFAADIDSRIAGFMTLREDGYIDLAFIKADAMNTGVGTALYDELESTASLLNIPRLHAFISESAKQFFLKRAWTLIKTQTIERRSVEITNNSMEKTLTLGCPTQSA